MVTSKKDSLAILDVGHGNCAVLIGAGGVTVIDAGPGTTLLEYLTEQGVKTIDTVIVSHSDKDHIEGVIALLASKAFEIRRIRLNTDSSKKSKTWDLLTYELALANSTGKIDFKVGLTAGTFSDFNQGRVKMEVVGPSPYLAAKGPGSTDRNGRTITSNSHSVVIRVLVDNKPVALFPGDLDEIGLDDLSHFGAKVSAPVLIFPHHGGKPGAGASAAESFTQKLCIAVSPRMVIFSVGRNQHGTPRPEVVETIRKALQGVRIACTQLSTHCAKSTPAASSSTAHLLPVFSHGREARKSCAGTIIIYLDDPEQVLPALDIHQKFILSATTTPLCMPPVHADISASSAE